MLSNGTRYLAVRGAVLVALCFLFGYLLPGLTPVDERLGGHDGTVADLWRGHAVLAVAAAGTYAAIFVLGRRWTSRFDDDDLWTLGGAGVVAALVLLLFGQSPWLWGTGLAILVVGSASIAGFSFSPRTVQLLFVFWLLVLGGILAVAGDGPLAERDSDQRSLARASTEAAAAELSEALTRSRARESLIAEVATEWGGGPLDPSSFADLALDYPELGDCDERCVESVRALDLDTNGVRFAVILADELQLGGEGTAMARAITRYRTDLKSIIGPQLVGVFTDDIERLPTERAPGTTGGATQEEARAAVTEAVDEKVDGLSFAFIMDVGSSLSEQPDDRNPSCVEDLRVGDADSGTEASWGSASLQSLQRCRLRLVGVLVAELEDEQNSRTVIVDELATGSAERTRASRLLEITTAELAAARETLATLEEAASSVEDPQHSIWRRIQSGADRLMTALLDPLDHSDSSVHVDSLGWAVVGVLGLALFRSVSATSYSRQTGPVTVRDFIDEAGAEAAPSHGARIRAHLADANIHEPGRLPESDSAVSLASLTSEVDSRAGNVAALASALPRLLSGSGGYEVLGSAAVGTDDQPTTVRVQLRRVRSGRVIYASEMTRERPDEAFRAAALGAAVAVVNRSRRLPSWGRWDNDTGVGLGAYLEAEKLKLDSPLRQPLLVTALSKSPSSGLVQVALSHHHIGQGELLHAAVAAAQAVRNSPRFLVARYRLAAALSMSASDPATHILGSGHAAGRSELRRLLQIDISDDADPGSLEHTKACLLATAESEARYVATHANSRWSTLALALLLPSERSAWLDLRRRHDRPGRMLAGAADSLIDIIELRRQAPPETVDELRRKQPEPVQDAYNQACYLSVGLGLLPRRPGDEAGVDSLVAEIVGYLNAARNTPLIPPPTISWIESDPDLEPLRDERRFRQWLADVKSASPKPEELVS